LRASEAEEERAFPRGDDGLERVRLDQSWVQGVGVQGLSSSPPPEDSYRHRELEMERGSSWISSGCLGQLWGDLDVTELDLESAVEMARGSGLFVQYRRRSGAGRGLGLDHFLFSVSTMT